LKGFGDYLAERREALSVSQAELARRMGITASTISRWERGGGVGVRVSTGDGSIYPMDINRICVALHADDPDPSRIDAEIFVMKLAAGFLPEGVAEVLEIPSVAAIAMHYRELTADAQEYLDDRISLAIEQAREMSNG
jgi:transcriptional regulator with XRE-family HTH domain